jgi:undecaprenyl pyrophosphate phosphatase UppP
MIETRPLGRAEDGSNCNDAAASHHPRDRRRIDRVPTDLIDGALILASKLLGLSQTDFQKSFEIAIQLGAIASVVMLYWRSFFDPAVLSRVIVAFIPTGIIGFALYRVVKNYLFDSEAVVLWALGLGGVALIVFELLHREREDAVDESPRSPTPRHC